ncbi:MAG: hypothetical protein WDZ30_07900 [Cellvibrionaceae bacterium]
MHVSAPVKTLGYASAFLLLVVGIPAIAEPEEAPTEGWVEQFKRAEWVSRVRIEGVGSLVNPALSRSQLLAIQGYRYNASVIRAWKGEQAGTIKFQVDLGDCNQALEVDGEYVVFGSTDHQGRLQSFSCEDLVGVESATGLLPALDRAVVQSDS